MVKVEYWSTANTGNADKKFKFYVASAAAASSAPVIDMQETIIPKDSFETTHKTITYPVLLP